MSSCVVIWCKKIRKQSSKTETGITYHRFPKKELPRLQWINAVRLERRQDDWLPSYASRVCSLHFEDEDMYSSSTGYRMLKKSAVPVCTMVRDNKLRSLEISANTSRVQSSELQKQTMVRDNKLRAQETSANTSRVQSSELQKQTMVRDNELRTQDISANTSHKYQGMIKCPHCTYEFNVHIDLKNEEFTSAKKEKMVQPDDDDLITTLNAPASINEFVNETEQPAPGNDIRTEQFCSTPINIPSSDSDIESVLDSPRTHSFKQQIRNKSKLAEKRLLKIRNLQRKNKRLQIKNRNLKDILNNLKNKGYE